jgi:hypothetical protein
MLAFLHARDAKACSPPCHPTQIAPAEGATIPASAPGIPIQLGAQETDATVGFELRDASGALIGGALKKDATSRTYFSPTATLAPGAYTARFKSDCEAQGAPAPFFKTSTFQVTAPAALPGAAGNLRVARAVRQKTDATTSSGSCVEDVDAAMVDLAVDVDPATTPYLPVLSWETHVDGHFWSRAEGTLAQPGSLAHSLLRLFTPCDTAGTQGRHPGVTAGEHDVEVRAILVGGTAAIAPAKIRVNVTCGADNGKVVPTTTTPPTDPPKPITTPTPPKGDGTSSGDPASTSSATPESSSGCATNPARRPPPAGAALALGLLLATLGRLCRRGARSDAEPTA